MLFHKILKLYRINSFFQIPLVSLEYPFHFIIKGFLGRAVLVIFKGLVKRASLKGIIKKRYFKGFLSGPLVQNSNRPVSFYIISLFNSEPCQSSRDLKRKVHAFFGGNSSGNIDRLL